MSSYSDNAFLRRLHVINALEKLEDVQKVRVPKEEVDGEEMEVIKISSDEVSDEMEVEKENTPSVSQEVIGKKALLEKRILGDATNTKLPPNENSNFESSGLLFDRLHSSEN